MLRVKLNKQQKEIAAKILDKEIDVKEQATLYIWELDDIRAVDCMYWDNEDRAVMYPCEIVYPYGFGCVPFFDTQAALEILAGENNVEHISLEEWRAE